VGDIVDEYLHNAIISVQSHNCKFNQGSNYDEERFGGGRMSKKHPLAWPGPPKQSLIL
jgi:hypothetical protein